MRLKVQTQDLKSMAKLITVVEEAGQTIALRSYKRLFFVIDGASEGLISELRRKGAHITTDTKYSAD